MSKKPLSREAIRAIAIRNSIARREREAAAKAAQGILPGIVDETPVEGEVVAMRTMHPRLLRMCVDSAGFDQNERYVEAA